MFGNKKTSKKYFSAGLVGNVCTICHRVYENESFMNFGKHIRPFTIQIARIQEKNDQKYMLPRSVNTRSIYFSTVHYMNGFEQA